MTAVSVRPATVDDAHAIARVHVLSWREAYAGRMPEDLAAAEMKKATGTPDAKLHFAYAGSPKPGEPYTYRIQAPEFVVEFLNIQKDSAGNPANHIHSAWRRLPADFGLSE